MLNLRGVSGWLIGCLRCLFEVVATLDYDLFVVILCYCCYFFEDFFWISSCCLWCCSSEQRLAVSWNLELNWLWCLSSVVGGWGWWGPSESSCFLELYYMFWRKSSAEEQIRICLSASDWFEASLSFWILAMRSFFFSNIFAASLVTQCETGE